MVRYLRRYEPAGDASLSWLETGHRVADRAGSRTLDGLADVADGFFGAGTPERRLEIMKDSRIGAFGTLALILVLLLAWVIVVLAFFIIAVQVFITLIEFKLVTLAGFVLLPMVAPPEAVIDAAYRLPVEPKLVLITGANTKDKIVTSADVWPHFSQSLQPILLLRMHPVLLIPGFSGFFDQLLDRDIAKISQRQLIGTGTEPASARCIQCRVIDFP